MAKGKLKEFWKIVPRAGSLTTQQMIDLSRDHTCAQIAAMAGVTKNAVIGRLYRAKVAVGRSGVHSGRRKYTPPTQAELAERLARQKVYQKQYKKLARDRAREDRKAIKKVQATPLPPKTFGVMPKGYKPSGLMLRAMGW